MKPIEQLTTITAYQLLKLSTSGKFEIEAANVTEQGDIGVGFYSDLKTVQYQQMILALKNIKTHIYPIEWLL